MEKEKINPITLLAPEADFEIEANESKPFHNFLKYNFGFKAELAGKKKTPSCVHV